MILSHPPFKEETPGKEVCRRGMQMLSLRETWILGAHIHWQKTLSSLMVSRKVVSTCVATNVACVSFVVIADERLELTGSACR